MKQEIINILVKTGILRKRQIDISKIKSAIEFAKINAGVTKSIPLNDNSATLIFREIYESIRQLGDVKWWISGYEPQNHDISLGILKEIEIRNKVKLNFLERFKQIRHDANYKGFRISVSQAKEIIEFWDECGKDIIDHLLKAININENLISFALLKSTVKKLSKNLVSGSSNHKTKKIYII